MWIRELSYEQAFDFAAAGHPTTTKARRKDACVVENQYVTGCQVITQIREVAVLTFAGFTVEYQQSRSASLGRRLLSDQPIRQLEIEFGDVHLIRVNVARQ